MSKKYVAYRGYLSSDYGLSWIENALNLLDPSATDYRTALHLFGDYVFVNYLEAGFIKYYYNGIINEVLNIWCVSGIINDELYVIKNDSKMYKTKDMINWVKIFDGPLNSYYNQGGIYIDGSGSKISFEYQESENANSRITYLSTDNGNTFNKIAPDEKILQSIDFNGTWFYCDLYNSNDSLLYKSIDKGKSWVSYVPKGNMIGNSCINATNNYLRRGISFSKDNGNSFLNILDELSDGSIFYSIVLDDYLYVLYNVGFTDKRVLYRRNILELKNK